MLHNRDRSAQPPNGAMGQTESSKPGQKAAMDCSGLITEVAPGLFIGCAPDAPAFENTDILSPLGITHVLNCAHECDDLDTKIFEHIQAYRRLDMEDSKGFPIESTWCDCLSFVDEALRADGKVLVHCVMGRSRSAAMLLYCQLHGAGGREPLTLRAAYRALFQVRHGNVGVNFGFFEKLIEEDTAIWGAGSVTMDEYNRIIDDSVADP